MNAPVIKPAFADKLPPRKPTLQDLINAYRLAKLAEERIEWRGPGDRRDLEAWDDVKAAEQAIIAKLMEQGVSREDAQQMAGGLA